VSIARRLVTVAAVLALAVPVTLTAAAGDDDLHSIPFAS
jgi:hypothetical protein